MLLLLSLGFNWSLGVGWAGISIQGFSGPVCGGGAGGFSGLLSRVCFMLPADAVPWHSCCCRGFGAE